MTKHIHSHLMMLYAQDAMETAKPWERWEYRIVNSVSERGWGNIHSSPTWSEQIDYRRKQKTININGFDVPYPLRTFLKEGEEYYIVSLETGIVMYFWENTYSERLWMERGLIHLTKKAADIHREALLSFTKV